MRNYLAARSAARGKSIFTSPKRYRSFIEPLESRHLLAATVIEVNTTADIVDPNDAFTSLREAILAANASPEDNEIVLAAGTYTLTRQGANEEAGLSGDLDITDNGSLKIVGAGRDDTTIDAAGLYNAELGYGDRIFDVLAGADVDIEALTLTGGNLETDTLLFPADGGAIRNAGNLSLSNAAATQNTALIGGAISNAANAQLVVSGSTLSHNAALENGGAISNPAFGLITISDSELVSNHAGSRGGAIYSFGDGTISDSTISENTAVNEGGGLTVRGEFELVDTNVTGNDGGLYGGGIFASSYAGLTITGGNISGNTAQFGGGIYKQVGGLSVDSTQLSENSATEAGGAVYSGGTITPGYVHRTTISNTTLLKNSANAGGAIYNSDSQLTVLASTFLENEAAGSGGALYHGLSQFLDAQAGRLWISNSQFDQNQARTGGAVYNQGWATIAGSSFTNNVATRDGGAIFLTNYPATVSDCVVTDNIAQWAAGGISAGSLSEGGPELDPEYRFRILRSNISRNSANGTVFGDGGGGIRVSGKSLVEDCVLSQNKSTRDGGGVHLLDAYAIAPSTFRDCTLTGNSSNEDGGAFRAIIGEFEIIDTIFDSNSARNGGGLHTNASVYAEVVGSTFTNNVAVQRGGAIATAAEMLINDCDLGNNSAADGGAIAGGDRLEITASRVFNNVASQSGGGIYANAAVIRGSSVIGNSAIRGGGVFVIGYEFRSLIIERSTLADNSSTDGGAVFSDTPAVHIKSSTLSGNAATNNGGALHIGGSLTVHNSTVTLNRSDADGDGSGLGGGILLDSSSGAVLENSIVAGNLNGLPGVDTADELGSFAGSFAPASSYNLIGDPGSAGGLTDGVNGNIVGDGSGGVLDINTVLDTMLADNGGPTLTHSLPDDSPAVNAGDPNFDSGAVPFDQRAAGFARVTGGQVDIGAFEFGSEFENIVAGRHIFYNNSWYDWNDTNGNLHDNDAIDPSKHALLPDGTLADASNVTSYSRGINGIMVDLAGSHPNITADDFIFRIGANNDPASWAAAPEPSAIQVYAGQGVGGADRIVITWPDGAILNTYLQVIAAANEDTGLAEPDVFFFGNLVGESFSTQPPAAFVTSAADELAARNATPKIGLNVANVFDFNKDGKISSADMLIARNNPGLLPRIQIALPAEASPLAAAAIPTGFIAIDSDFSKAEADANAVASARARVAAIPEVASTENQRLTVPSERLLQERLVDRAVSMLWDEQSESAASLTGDDPLSDRPSLLNDVIPELAFLS